MLNENSSAEKKSLLDKWRNRKNANETIPGLTKKPEGINPPLSFGQRQLWFLQQLYPQNPFYNYADVFKFNGILNEEVLIESFKIIAQRHEILRTTFEVADGLPFQKINNEPLLKIKTIDLRHFSAEDKAIKLNEYSLEEARQVFDLEKGPLTSIAILKLTDDENVLLLTMHHIITDKWSMRILREELAEIYSSLIQSKPSNLKNFPIQYADFSYWKISQLVNEKSLNYWKEKLGGALPVLNLPTDKTRPAIPSFNGGYHTNILSFDFSQKLLTLAKENNSTLFNLLLTAYKILLYKYSDQKDILIGTPITNRDQTSLEKLIGFFNDTVVLRSDLSNNPTFVELLGKVRQTTLEAFANKNISFETLVKTLQPERKLSINPIFQSMFLFHQVPDTPSFGEGLEVIHEPYDFGVSKFDLTLYVSNDKNQLSTTFEYASDLFEKSTIDRMLGHLEILLENIVENPQQSLEQLSILSSTEQQLILTEWNDNSVAVPDISNIHKLIEQQVDKKPNDIAVTFNNEKLTYSELNKKAEVVAAHLQKSITNDNPIIGLCTERSMDLIVGILGILKAGGAYLPLDPEYPKERINFMLEDAAVSLVLTQVTFKEKFSTDISVFEIEKISNPNEEERKTVTVNLYDTAYMIYTSGSTGNPKGVLVSHENLIHSTTARFQFYPTKPSHFLLMSSYAFDSSVVGIFWTLCYGGTLVIPPKRIEQDMNILAELIHKHRVSHTLLLPSLYDLLLQYAPNEKLSSLKTVIVAGESCPSSLVQHHFDTIPKVDLYNEYGPTEASVWSIAHKVESKDANAIVPIGRPISNTQIYILDKNFQPVPIGVVGELYIGGLGVTQGYHQQSQLTDAKFILNPFDVNSKSRLYKTGDLARYRSDGIIEFHGRVDHQVKIRGYRIELDEIRRAILSDKNIQDAIVVVQNRVENKSNEKNEVEQLVKKLRTIQTDEAQHLITSIEKLSL